MTHALRKSEGPFAAGTRVKVLSENSDGTYTVEVLVTETASINVDEMVFDIEKGDVVKLRERTGEVPTVTREQRRKVLNNLFQLPKSTDPR